MNKKPDDSSMTMEDVATWLERDADWSAANEAAALLRSQSARLKDLQTALEEARTELFGLCEQMTDEAADKLAASEASLKEDKPSVHERGYWRGQKSTAKSIARAMGEVFRDRRARQALQEDRA